MSLKSESLPTIEQVKQRIAFHEAEQKRIEEKASDMIRPYGTILLFAEGQPVEDHEALPLQNLLIYSKENMALTDWEDIKASIQSGSPVVWNIIHRRSKTKSVDVIR